MESRFAPWMNIAITVLIFAVLSHFATPDEVAPAEPKPTPSGFRLPWMK